MSRKVRFIHAADVHLGSAIRGLCDIGVDWMARLQEASAAAYEHVIDAALTHGVDFVVLAGDVVDSSRLSYGDYVRLFAGFGRLDAAGIPLYLVTGNHDPYTSWAGDRDRLPASTHLLGVDGPEYALFSRGDEPLCLIGARSYYNQVWSTGDDIAAGITRTAAEEALRGCNPRAKEAPFSIGLIHASLEFDTSKAPLSQAELMSSGIDYWACGHLHDRWAYPNGPDPRIVFPGCTQGRNMKETGERGCYLVELEEASPSARPNDGLASVRLEFLPTASVALQQLEINVGACQTLADVRRLVQAELFRANGKVHCDDMVAHVALVGRTDLHGYLTRGEVTEELRRHINNAHPSFFCDALVDRTRPVEDGGQTTGEVGLFSTVVSEIAEEERAREDVLINYAQNELVKRGIAVPAAISRQIGRFLDDAEMLVLDKLREDER